MNDEAPQAILPHNNLDLVFPKVDRTLIQNMEQHVVLRGGDGEFQDFVDKIRHHGATATPLGVKVRHVGHRHIEGKIKSLVPQWVSVKHCGTKSLCLVIGDVAIDECSPSLKFFPIVKQPTIVVEVLDANLES